MKKNICQIIGYFNQPSANPQFKRVIMKNFSNERYNFYLFIQSSMRTIYSKKYLGNNNNVFFFSSNATLYKLLIENKINYIVLSIDFFKLYDCINRFNQDKIYHIGHGVTPFYYLKNTIKYFNHWKSTRINILTCCSAQYEIVSKNKKNIYKIGSLPQFENLLLTKENLEEKKSQIYIVGPRRNDINSYKNMSNILLTIKHELSLPIFYRKTRVGNLSNSFYANNNIYIQNPHDLIYSYYSSEIIIIFDGGTSYLESLMVNSKVILYIENFGTNFKKPPSMSEVHYIEILHYLAFPYKKFPSLLIAQDLSTLEKHLNTIKTNPNYFETEEYLKDKNQFIKDSIGEYIPNVSKQLIDIIEKVEANN